MRGFWLEVSSCFWLSANRVAGYVLVNLLDDPALLALAFC
jgi:hypothetical protein